LKVKIQVEVFWVVMPWKDTKFSMVHAASISKVKIQVEVF
jgi:hypothetical protein